MEFFWLLVVMGALYAIFRRRPPSASKLDPPSQQPVERQRSRSGTDQVLRPPPVQTSAVAVRDVPLPLLDESARPPPQCVVIPTGSQATWVPLGSTASIVNATIAGGGFYFGSTTGEFENEPAVVDPGARSFQSQP